jgi:spermidine synthase
LQAPNGIISRSKYIGLALVSLCILVLELTLTRIFSVTMWYHFAFVAISVALFGISASGLVVFLLEKMFPVEKLDKHLSLFSSLMAISIVATLFVTLRVPFAPSLTLGGILRTALIYGTVVMPFFLGGICISLILWRHSDRVSGLYFADLLGAAVGCLVTLLALNVLPGPQVLLLAAVIAAGASLCFAFGGGGRTATIFSGATLAGALLLFAFSGSASLTKLMLVKNPGGTGQTVEEKILFEKWNSFSRITVHPMAPGEVFGWGLSENFDGHRPPQLFMRIDASAGTQIVGFDGDFDKVDFLKYDVTSLVHWIKERARVLIIGPGGGRDVLAALTFGQKQVIGVEINPVIVDAIRDDFGDFAGNLYDRPDVEIHMDEGRSFLSRSKDSYDIIQASLVDTWAATSSGAFVLTENNLYTVEAFEAYLSRLNDDGMLTFSRWYYERAPGEALRLTALAIEALERAGVEDTRAHLLLAKKGYWAEKAGPDGVATMIMKKSPFTAEELEKAVEACERMDFQLVYSPEAIEDPVFNKLFDKASRNKFFREFPLDIVPPTDDKPFFFHLIRFRHLLTGMVEQGAMQFNVDAVLVLANLFLVMVGFAFLFLILPMLLARSLKLPQLLTHWKHLAYFMLIGLGFIMVEIPLIQRFTLFLGHPIYSLAVVLFSLLLFSSLGSFFTRRAATEDQARGFILKALGALCVIVLVYIFLLEPLIHGLIAMPTPAKILVSLALIAPLGFLMGMPFPLGVRLVAKDAQFLIPWCWSLNGAFSVLASVGSIAIAISSGFSVAMASGGAAYLAVLILVASTGRK